MADINTNMFFVSVHVDPMILVAPFKKIALQHGIIQYAVQGRPSGDTYRSTQVLPKIEQALCDEGAIPFHRSTCVNSYFVTRLAPHWAKAIEEFSRVGVRIYIVPVLRAVEGLPDAVSDSFDKYYTERFSEILKEAREGADVYDVLELTISQACAFECEEIILEPSHHELIAQIRQQLEQSKDRVAKMRATPLPAEPPVNYTPVDNVWEEAEISLPDDFDDEHTHVSDDI
jgi:hypothetical protein